MELVRNIDTEPVKRVLMENVVALLNDLGIAIVCEGIETPAELDVIRDLGVGLFQGYLFGRPSLEALVKPDMAGFQ